MNIGPSLVADGQAAEATQPGQGALDHPAMSPQPRARVDALAGDTNLDMATAQRLPTARIIVAFVGVQLGGPLPALAGGTLDRRDRIEQLVEDDRVVAVGSGQERSERDPAAVAHNMALRARHPLGLAAIRRVGAGELAPLLAEMLAESSDARLQSMRSASPRRSRRARWRRSQTPASCQSRKRRQQVMPEPQPNSCGNISHGMPLRSTKMIAVKTARSGTRGRPPLGLGGSGGSSGATTAHNSSLTRGLLMAQVCHATPRF